MPVEIHYRPILLKTTLAKTGTLHRDQRQTEREMSFRSNKFHQYKTFQNITPVCGKIAKPRLLRAKGDQSLVPSITLRSMGNKKRSKKSLKDGFKD